MPAVAASTDIPEFRAYQDAQGRLFAKLGLSYRSHFVQLDRPRLRAHVIEVGTGQPVFFLHGGGNVAAAWAPMLAHLEGVRALAADRPGCGLTDGFDYFAEPDLRTHAVSFIESTLDALGLQQVPIVASSMGGQWALWFAVDRPQRVSSLVQMGMPAFLLQRELPLFMRLMSVKWLSPLMALMMPPSLKGARQGMKYIGHDPERLQLPEEFYEAYYRYQLLPTYPDGWTRLVQAYISFSGTRPDLVFDAAQLARVRQPLLFIWGANDPFGSVELAHRAASIAPNARVQVIDRGGHLPWLDDPPRAAALTRAFLRGTA